MPWSAAWPLLCLAGRRPLFAQAALAIVQAVLPFAGLLAMQHLIDAVAAGLAGRNTPADALAAATLATLAAGLVAFAGSALRSFVSVLSENHGRALTDALVLRVQTHAATLDLADFDRPAFHDLLQKAGAEASQRPVRLVQDGLAVLVAGLGLLTMGLWLTRVAIWLPILVAAAALPIAFVRARHARERLAWQDQNVGTQRDAGYAGAVLTGRATSKDVRLLDLAVAFGTRLASLRAKLRESLAELARRRARGELGVTTLASAGLFAAYYVLARTALAGGLSLGELVLQAQAAQRAQNGVRDLLAALMGEREHRQFLVPVVEFLARKSAMAPTPATPPPAADPAAPALAFGDVTFRYPETNGDALRGLTFRVARGERVALVGANGSGKSTIVKLLARLYDPDTGIVAGDGVDLRTWPLPAWRAKLSLLLQDAALFELSLRANLALGTAAPPPDDALWSALATVGLDAKVRALHAGLDTMCSRRVSGGVDWSTGEARRLVLARALVPAVDLLVVDEPFAALDRDTALGVARALAALPRSRTLVVVDHRLDCLRFCDRVLVLERGAVVAEETPAGLAARDPRFAALRPE
ncbi:MAG: ABC transporter ATP-binding protein [Planctomycetota bacterium]